MQGFIGADMAIAIVSVIVFSGLIFSLMYFNALQNVKIRKQVLASLYLTQTMEYIAMEDYEVITQENIDNNDLDFAPEDMDKDKYTIHIEVSPLELSPDIEDEDIAKRVKATIQYFILDKTYQYSMERIKIKEQL